MPEEANMKTYQTFGTKQTPQKEPVPGKDMVQNSAEGYSFGLDKWDRLDRFLILGSEGGTYYIKEKELTKENALNLLELINEDGVRVVNRIVEISDQGRAPKNDPALFALAAVFGVGDLDARQAAEIALPKVARIGTHLFHFAAYLEQFRGWGQLAMRAVSNWYIQKDPTQLAYQVVKYQQRDGWSHRDLLRLSHPKPPNEEINSLFRWVTKGELDTKYPIQLIQAFEEAKHAEDVKTITKLIIDYNLPREAIPTQWLKQPEVWEVLLQKMPVGATIRNLGRMTSIGILGEMSDNTKIVVDRITNQEVLVKGRVHPLVLLNALNVYGKSAGVRTQWEPVRQILDALDEAFYLSFGAVEPANKRLMLALDISSSMAWRTIAGMSITPREASAALALVTANVESQYLITAFATTLEKLAISPRQRMDDAIDEVSSLRFGGTDCALPMIYAKEKGIEVDAFYVYTDSETWYGNIHPFQALQDYRNATGINAKLVVVGMQSNGFTIADPSDPGMLDVVGFDTTVPNIMTQFVK